MKEPLKVCPHFVVRSGNIKARCCYWQGHPGACATLSDPAFQSGDGVWETWNEVGITRPQR